MDRPTYILHDGLISTGRNPERLSGKGVLVVEDEVIVALDIQMTLEDAGARVVGPAHTLRSALERAEHEEISAAILDLRLGRDSIEPVARTLARRGIPFLFYTGQSRADPLRSEWPSAPLLSKPASAQELIGAVSSLLG